MIVEKDLDGQKVPVPLTVLLDHDVIDGAPMPRFLSNLSENLEKGIVVYTLQNKGSYI